MFFMWLIPVLLIVFVVYAVSGNDFVNVFRPGSSRTCPQCNKPAQNNWQVCPHCGQAL